MMEFNNILLLIGCSLSGISTALVIFVYIFRPYLRTKGFFLVFNLCLMDFVFCFIRGGSLVYYYLTKTTI
jgi:hypothetical protein